MLLRLCCFLLLAALLPAGPPDPPAGWREGYVLVNGLRIHYWRTGGAKPVMVLAHGSSDDGLCWTNFAREFTADYDIVMYDARGHGLSDPPPANNTADGMAEDLAALIRELKLVSPVVMGHSMGSSTAAWFAAKYPDVAKAVILEDPGLGARRATENTPEAVEKRRQTILARNNQSFEELFAGCMKGSPKWGASECAIWVPSKQRHHPNTALPVAMQRPSMRDLFPKITAPVLILKADAQGEVREQNLEAAKLLPRGKLVHIDGAGHNVRRENKQMAVETTKAFLASLK